MAKANSILSNTNNNLFKVSYISEKFLYFQLNRWNFNPTKLLAKLMDKYLSGYLRFM